MSNQYTGGPAEVDAILNSNSSDSEKVTEMTNLVKKWINEMVITNSEIRDYHIKLFYKTRYIQDGYKVFKNVLYDDDYYFINRFSRELYEAGEAHALLSTLTNYRREAPPSSDDQDAYYLGQFVKCIIAASTNVFKQGSHDAFNRMLIGVLAKIYFENKNEKNGRVVGQADEEFDLMMRAVIDENFWSGVFDIFKVLFDFVPVGRIPGLIRDIYNLTTDVSEAFSSATAKAAYQYSYSGPDGKEHQLLALIWIHWPEPDLNIRLIGNKRYVTLSCPISRRYTENGKEVIRQFESKRSLEELLDSALAYTAKPAITHHFDAVGNPLGAGTVGEIKAGLLEKIERTIELVVEK